MWTSTRSSSARSDRTPTADPPLRSARGLPGCSGGSALDQPKIHSGAVVRDLLPDDFDRAKGSVDLLHAGYGDRIVLGHDNFTKAHGKSYGYYGFTRFPQFIPPILTRLGFDDDVYRRLVVDNPARVLAH
ncbi:hypothetical protein ACPZ19_48435 [Amycolatopsis lurida]